MSEYVGRWGTLDYHPVKTILWQTEKIVVFEDDKGSLWRYMHQFEKAWPIEIVAPGAATKIEPQLFSRPLESWYAVYCKAAGITKFGRFERRFDGPVCPSCYRREQWRLNANGPWVCMECHPSA